MNMLAERIKSLKLTKKQKVIAEYFIQNQERLGSLTSMEVANEIGVSDASVIRFSRMIGFAGYAELKDRIYEMLVEQASPSLSLTERHALNQGKYGRGDTAARFQQLIQHNTAYVFQQNKSEDFDRTAELLVSARTRYVIGVRGCQGVALQFGRLLSFMLPHVITMMDGDCSSVSLLQDVEPDDTVIAFALSRFYKTDVGCLRLARDRGARICLVTDEITGPLSNFSDIVLLVDISGVSFFHSTIGADIVAEYILSLVSGKAEFQERIDERDRATQEQRVF